MKVRTYKDIKIHKILKRFKRATSLLIHVSIFQFKRIIVIEQGQNFRKITDIEEDENNYDEKLIETNRS